MTTRLDTRLSRLEALKPKSGEILIAGLAVEIWPEDRDSERFFTDLVTARGWRDIGKASIFVARGPDATLFGPVRLERLTAADETRWLEMASEYPQANIVLGDGECLVLAHASAGDHQQWQTDARRLLATEA